MINKGDILLVEDTHASLKLMTDILTKEGYQVRPADSGELALSSVATKLPDLILLDIRMQNMDGFEVLQRLKAQEKSRDVPVIFLTAITELDKRVEGLKLGAVDFISKPFQSEELLARVQTHVELRRLRVRLEQQAVELRQSEQRYRSLFENMLEGFAYCKMLYDENNQPVDFIYLDVNQSFEQLAGLKNVVGKLVSEVIPGIRKLSPELFESYGRVASTGKPEKFEFDFKSLNQWLSISVYSPSKGYFVAVFDNITERKHTEDKLRSLSRAIEQSPASIVITDTNGAIDYVNPKFVQLTGYSLEEVMGKNPRVLKSGETPSEEYSRLWSIITSGGEWRGEFHNKKKNGELYWEFAVISPITDAHGVITHFLAVKEDITERKKTEQELQEAAKEHENLIRELQYALENIKTLQGLIPICANCKKIRDDKGFWNQVEGYISEHTDAKFSHGICPDCAKKHYGYLYEKAANKSKQENI